MDRPADCGSVSVRYGKGQYSRYEAALDALYQEVRHVLERQGFAPTIKSRVKDFDHYFDGSSQ